MTTQPPVTTTVKGTLAFNKNYYMKQASLLLAQMVRVRKKAKFLRKETYVSASDSLIRSLTQLMRAIGESKVDKDKVEHILGMFTKKAEDIASDLDKEMIRETTVEETTIVSTSVLATETTEKEKTVDTTLPSIGTTTEGETTTVHAAVPTTNATAEETTTEHADQISNTDRTAYTKQARTLIMECVRLRKKASQTGQRKYVGALNSYIKALARIMKQVRGSIFDKKQVEDALKLFKTKVNEIHNVLEESISTETMSIFEKTVEVTTPSVSEVGEFIVFVAGMKP